MIIKSELYDSTDLFRIIITVPAPKPKILWSNHDVALGHERRYQVNALRVCK